MKFSKRLFTKTVALAAICASVATASFAAPQGSFDTSEIHVTGQVRLPALWRLPMQYSH